MIRHKLLIDGQCVAPADNAAHVRNKDKLDGIIGAFVATRTQGENLALFGSAGVTVGPICSVAQLIGHPYVVGREALVELPDVEMGSVPMPNVIPRFSGVSEHFRGPAPKRDEIRCEFGMRGRHP